ncbi:excitatory amino acid transporter 3-like [Pseudoliparis swirei]|uniref:excitatory amino acid transporter 3-like n=1 Tax=Pseudoliparis swirei TaxID=2059687 RepID=UPI0024BD78C0|nr:excitatory amino acid transporter 3-like [Pseudoliparis swirei]
MKRFRPYSEESHYYLRLPGELLMGWLQTVSLPIMVTSVILGILNLRAPMKIALRAAFIFVLTTVVAVLIGLMLVLVIKPGAAYTEDEDDQQVEVEFAFMDSLIDLVRNVLPSNVMRLKTNDTVVQLEGHYVDGTNTLGLIVSALLTGVALKSMGESGQVIVDHMKTINALCKEVVKLIMWFWPFGLISIIASNIFAVYDLETMHRLREFVLVVIVGLLIHGCVALPALYCLLVRRNLWCCIKGILPALLTALMISSSVLAGISSLSAAGVPATGAVTTLFVLEVAGLPTENASILFAVEWILDRLNTVVNVWSDCICVEIVNALSQRELEEIEQEEQVARAHAE